jgi:hypothetical protein
MPLKTTIDHARTSLRNRRTERRAYRRLSAELAAFQTPAERTELDQMLSRHSAEETRQIREILVRQDFERQRTVAGLTGNGYRA